MGRSTVQGPLAVILGLAFLAVTHINPAEAKERRAIKRASLYTSTTKIQEVADEDIPEIEEVEPIYDTLKGLDLSQAEGSDYGRTCGSHGECNHGCGGCSGCGLSCRNDCCKSFFMGTAFTRFDGWKGQLDDNDNNNFGARVGFNLSHMLRHRLGVQGGLSYGAYDFHGREDRNQKSIEEQLYMTTGLFLASLRDSCCWTDRVGLGLVYDRLSTDNATQNGVDFSIGQLRYRAGYWSDPCNEWGVWGTADVDGKRVPGINRRVNTLTQGSLFWRHLWERGADTTAYFGFAEEPGEVVFGFNGEVPLSCQVSAYGAMQYILPSTQGGDQPTNNAFAEEFWNISVGLTWYFGCGAKSCSPWMPMLPVADNGSMPLRVRTGGF